MGCVPYTYGLRHPGPSAYILPVPSDLSVKVKSSGMPSVPQQVSQCRDCLSWSCVCPWAQHSVTTEEHMVCAY